MGVRSGSVTPVALVGAGSMWLAGLSQRCMYHGCNLVCDGEVEVPGTNTRAKPGFESSALPVDHRLRRCARGRWGCLQPTCCEPQHCLGTVHASVRPASEGGILPASLNMMPAFPSLEQTPTRFQSRDVRVTLISLSRLGALVEGARRGACPRE